jgi:hypothetical protein
MAEVKAREEEVICEICLGVSLIMTPDALLSQATMLEKQHSALMHEQMELDRAVS